MKNNFSKLPAILWLTMAVTVLALTASLGGIFLPDLYRDSDVITKGWFGNDLVTIPMSILLVISHLLQKQADERPMLVWMGLMLYMFYNYAFYLFGAAFNNFFLIYAALFSLSLFSIIIGLLNFNIEAIRVDAALRKKRLLIAVFLFLVAIPLGVVEITQCIDFIVSGQEPKIPTLVFALDLSIVIPTTILAAILLLTNQPWGNLLAMMMLVKSFAYGLVLLTATLLITSTGTPMDPLLPFYAFLVIGGLVFGLVHFRSVRPVI